MTKQTDTYKIEIWIIIIVNYRSYQSQVAIIKPINVSLRFEISLDSVGENEISSARRWNTALKFVGTFTPRIFQELSLLSPPCHSARYSHPFSSLLLEFRLLNTTWWKEFGKRQVARKRRWKEGKWRRGSCSKLETRHTTLLRLIEGSAN